MNKEVKTGKLLFSILMPALALVGAVIIGFVILLIAGYDPLNAFSALFGASFRNLHSFSQALVQTSPLLFTGIAVTFAFRASVYNIGAEGQFLMGAIMATWAGVSINGLPPVIMIPLVILCGAIGGGLWGFIPGYLKAKHGVSEIITTIMFNFLALRLLGFLVKGPLKSPASNMPQSARICDSAILPDLLPGTHLHIGFLIGVVLAFFLYIVLFKTYYGYEIRAVGFNPDAAYSGGINVNKTMIGTMVISGALAGIGGAVEMTGVSYILYEGISPGYGYTAVAVSLLANNNPIGVIFSSFIFGVLNTGASAMQRVAGVSSVIVSVFEGAVVLILAFSNTLTLEGIKAKFFGKLGVSNLIKAKGEEI